MEVILATSLDALDTKNSLLSTPNRTGFIARQSAMLHTIATLLRLAVAFTKRKHTVFDVRTFAS